MKFRSEIEPVLVTMERELEAINKRLDDKSKEWDKKIQLAENMRLSVERKMKDNIVSMNKVRDEYEEKERALDGLKQELIAEKGRMANTHKELEELRRKTAKEFDITNLTRNAAENERRKQSALTERIEKKLKLLLADEDRLAIRQKELNGKENDLKTKENMLFKQEQVLAEKDRELKIREIKLKGKEERVEREYIKIKLGEK